MFGTVCWHDIFPNEDALISWGRQRGADGLSFSLLLSPSVCLPVCLSVSLFLSLWIKVPLLARGESNFDFRYYQHDRHASTPTEALSD